MTLPIIEQLQAMTTDATRADWLQRCPYSILVKYQSDIAAVLEGVQFHAGVRCLEAELSLLAATRTGDGGMRHEPLFGAHIARSDMRAAAKRGNR